MITQLPSWIEVFFIAACVYAMVIFFMTNNKPKKLMGLIIGLAFVQSMIAYNGFYLNTEAMPPRLLLMLAPSMALIIYGLMPKQLAWMKENRNSKMSSFIHLVRIPVEIILFLLFTYKMIPELMTFEGRNFDVLAGITALVFGIMFYTSKVSKQTMIYWNYFGTGLIFFILINGLLSAELPFQQFAFDQPNRALAYFPFVLLPAIIVPLVIYTHITDIVKLKSDIKLE